MIRIDDEREKMKRSSSILWFFTNFCGIKIEINN